MPKTKDDRRSRRQEGGEPYNNNKSGGSGTATATTGRRGYSDGDRHQGGTSKHPGGGNNKRRNNNNQDGGGRGRASAPNNSEEEQAPCTSFDAMNLKPDLLKGIYAYGFEKPSAIQQRAIKPIVRGRDVIAQSQSGTGKTVRVYFFAFIVIVACILALMCHILPPLYSNISVVKIPFFRNYKLLTLNN